jgi:hypothetical protein
MSVSEIIWKAASGINGSSFPIKLMAFMGIAIGHCTGRIRFRAIT